MKIAIPLDENQKDICPSFGRCPWFLIWEEGREEIIANPGAQAQSGAGLQAAQCVADSGASVLITPRCGENAAQVFKEGRIEIYKSKGSDARENAQAWSRGEHVKLTHFHGGYHGIQ